MGHRVKPTPHIPASISPKANDREDLLGGLDDFFAGVDAMREYLERDNQSPMHQVERLSVLARELLRRRSAEELVTWLADHIGQALGSTGYRAQLLTSGGRVFVGGLAGAGTAAPDASPAYVVEIPGPDGPLARLQWMGMKPLANNVEALLAALLDAAGAALEHSLLDGPGPLSGATGTPVSR